jgi:aspartyl-tRNA(Asn)/glutamyl-tRNA(Gln) amidotransferase subunit C
VAVSEDDVRHIAALARLGLDDSRVDALAGELNGILSHMEVLQAVDTSHAEQEPGDRPATVLRADTGPQLALARAREAFAPEMRDGFFIVPRLASHEGEGERAP